MSRQFGSIGGARGDRAKLLIVLSLLALLVFSVVAILLFYTTSTTATTNGVVVVKEAEPEIKMIEVLVPMQEIEAGQPLEPALFRKEARPQISVSGRAVRDFEEIKGHYSRSLIVAGQPLYRDFITNIRPTNAITANIPEGYRAVTISVDARSSVEGWARPGAKVDVVWASKIRGQPAVTVIVQNARVLSAERQIDAKSQPGMPVPSTVTLLVSAADAAKIQLASTTGSLSLNLRGDNDGGKGTAAGSITLPELFGGASNPQGPQQPEGVVRMRGPDGSLQEFLLRDGKLVPADG